MRPNEQRKGTDTLELINEIQLSFINMSVEPSDTWTEETAEKVAKPPDGGEVYQKVSSPWTAMKMPTPLAFWRNVGAEKCTTRTRQTTILMKRSDRVSFLWLRDLGC